MKVRWGLVGAGWVARDFVIPAMEAAGNAELVAVADAKAGYLTVPQMLAAGVDAVYIATPNDSHAELTAQAAAQGKHVLCEKPMATSYADAVTMVRACQAAGVQYATAFDQRFHPAHVLLRQLIAEGALGTVTAARIHYACWLPPEWTAENWRTDAKQAGGGAFIDLAPHGLDLLQFLLGGRIIDLYCLKQHRVFDYEVDDGAAAIGRMEAGQLIALQVAYNCPDGFPRRTLEIIGTRAMATARNTMGQTPGGTVEITMTTGQQRLAEYDAERSPFLGQIEAFSQCVLEGEPFPFSPEHDLHTMELISRCL